MLAIKISITPFFARGERGRRSWRATVCFRIGKKGLARGSRWAVEVFLRICKCSQMSDLRDFFEKNCSKFEIFCMFVASLAPLSGSDEKARSALEGFPSVVLTVEEEKNTKFVGDL
jgi:hypothetical protein